MDTVNKAKWHLEVNGGYVPVLEMPCGTLLNESRVLMELANDLGKDNGFMLYDKDPMKAAKQRVLMEKFAAFGNDFNGFMISKGKKDFVNKHFAQVLIEMDQFIVNNRKSNKTWLLGYDNPSMPDIFMFPMLERLVLMKETSW